MYKISSIKRYLLSRKQALGLFSWRFLLPGQPPSVVFHRKLVMKQLPQIPRPVLLLAVLWIGFRWMFVYSPYYTFHAVKYYGSRTKKVSGLSLMQQYYKALSASMGHGLCPYSWYKFHLYKNDSGGMGLWNHIYNQEVAAFHAFRNYKRLHHKKHTALLSDKYHFEQYLSEHELASASSIRKVLKGDLNFHSYLKEMVRDHGAIFCKPRSGCGGFGAFGAFHKNDQLKIHPLKMATLPDAEITQYLADRIQSSDYLIQPAYTNHHSLRLYCRSIMTIRIITAYDEQEIYPELAIFFWPIMNGHKVRFHYPIAIELQSGRLGKSLPEWPRDGFTTEELKELEGFLDVFQNQPLPFWPEALQQALAAHKLFSGVDQVAWDLILSEDQAVLLEGNSCWGGLDVCQWFGYDVKRFMR